MSRLYFPLLLLISIFIISCNPNKDESALNKSLFGKLENGTDVYMFTLHNTSGVEAKLIEYGATLVSFYTPDRNGKIEDIVLGNDDLEGYLKFPAYFGAIVGRFGNRIGKGKFSLDGTEYQLTINDGENHLHGGIKGFDKAVWKGEMVENIDGESVKFSYVSPDGEEGYPGEVKIEVVYTLTSNNELKIEYQATSNKPTIINPTHHSYFNLSGSFENTILDHELMIDADFFTPVDKGLIPTGELREVTNTPLDFGNAVKIGARINDEYEQMILGHGYDHNWVLNNFDGSVKMITTLYEPNSGRLMEVYTDQPGMQFYSGNFLNGTIVGKNKIIYQYRTGLCLEAQHFPDSPNKPEFPPVTLIPGEVYKQTTIYKFSTK